MKNSNKPVHFSLTGQIPNMFTIMGLCAGLTAIRFALYEKWEIAVAFILIAALLDGMDGRLARMLEASSKLGAQLDSLADFISFGIAPALVIYLWEIRYIEIRGLGWALVLIFTTCMGLRLARFNSELDDDNKPDWHAQFFKGIPAPAGGLLLLCPMMISFFLQEKFNITAFPIPTYYIGLYMFILSFLLISKIPTFSGKDTTISKELVAPILAGIVIIISAFIIEPWLTLPVIGALYVMLIPVSTIVFRRLSSK